MLPFQAVITEDLAAVNDFIIEQLHSDVGLVENIGHYIVDAGGKRLRPMLVLLASNCISNEQNKTAQRIPMAAVIEFIHTATLLHDDVVDLSELRRGKPTANAQWGNAPSVLVGDFLYSRAFQLLVGLESMDVMRIIADATNVISEGEVQQLVHIRNAAITENEYFDVIWKKTAVLFEAACESAAALNHASVALRRQCKQFGHHLGIAFQLIDDALDYQGSAEQLGKNIGDDLAEGKVTLPLIYALQHCTSQERTILVNAIEKADVTELKDILDIINNTGALAYTQQQAKNHIDQAKAALSALPQNPVTQAMYALADFAIARKH